MATLADILKINRPWVLGVANQPAVLCGLGMCDPTIRSSVNGPHAFRYGNVNFRGTIASAGADIIFASAEAHNLFQTGIGDLATTATQGFWWTQTAQDTDFSQGGNPMPPNLSFVVTGLAVTVGAAYQRNQTSTVAATDAKLYNAFLRPGAGYHEQIVAEIASNVGITGGITNFGCTYQFGLLQDYPAMSAPAGGSLATNGLTCTPGTYLPLQAAMLISSNVGDQQFFMTLTHGQAANIGSIGANPTSVSNTAGTSLTESQVNVPVRVVMPGYPVCVPADVLCGTDSSQALALAAPSGYAR